MLKILNTLRQIWHSDSVSPARGYLRHAQWHLRQLLGGFPVDLPLSHSVLHVEKAMGVAALVNSMGKYDYNNMSFVTELLAHIGGTFFDVGANIGTYTLVASEVPTARVISIEPHPATFTQLIYNVKRNGRSNVTCLGVALSDHMGNVRLTNLEDVAVNRVLGSDEEANQSVTVPCRTMASMCSDLGVAPDFVKIDVEGHESAVLQGFGIEAVKCNVLFVEGGERAGILHWMQESGFAGPMYVHFKKHLLARTPQPREEDPVFIRKSLVPLLRQIGFDLGDPKARNARAV